MPNLNIVGCFISVAEKLVDEAVAEVNAKANELAAEGKAGLNALIDKAKDAGTKMLSALGTKTDKPNFASDLGILFGKIKSGVGDVQKEIAEFTTKWKKVEAQIGKKISDIITAIDEFDICSVVNIEGVVSADGSYDIVTKSPPTITPSGEPLESLPSPALGEDRSVLPDRHGLKPGDFTADGHIAGMKIINEIFVTSEKEFVAAAKYQREERDEKVLADGLNAGYFEGITYDTPAETSAAEDFVKVTKRSLFCDLSDAAFDNVLNILSSRVAITGQPLTPGIVLEEIVTDPLYSTPQQNMYTLEPLDESHYEYTTIELVRALDILIPVINTNAAKIYDIHQRSARAKDVVPVIPVKGNANFDSQAAIKMAQNSGTRGFCARGVANIARAQGLGNFDNINANQFPGRMASQGWHILEGGTPFNAPVGSILTYGDSGGSSGGAKFGHVEFVAQNASGGRTYVSDYTSQRHGGSVPGNFSGVWVRD